MNAHYNRSRPLLFFNHNPKAGGGTIRFIIEALKKCKIDSDSYEKYIIDDNHTIEIQMRNDTTWTTSSEHDFDHDNCVVYVNEYSKGKSIHRKHGFVIGNIREPCSHYVSLWGYASIGMGGHYRFAKNHGFEHLLGRDYPQFSSKGDINRFQEWLGRVEGLISKRTVKSYGSNFDMVDCWVILEDFQNSMLRCLLLYEKQGGFVNWKVPEVIDLVQNVIKQNQSSSQRYLSVPEAVSRLTTDTWDSVEAAAKMREEIREQQYQWMQQMRGFYKREPQPNYTKNDVDSSVQHAHHESCINYFNNTLLQNMRNGKEKSIFDHFGYEGCCQKAFNHSLLEFDDISSYHTLREIVHVMQAHNATKESRSTSFSVEMDGDVLFFKQFHMVSAITALVLVLVIILKVFRRTKPQ